MADQYILVVEDDASLASWIADYLTENGFEVSVANRGDTALSLIESERPDLVILDLNLPVLDGLSVCRQARKFYAKPILMLTARDLEDDEVAGLNTGASDYLTKPVRPKVLLARIRALIRQDIGDPSTVVLQVGDLTLNRQSRAVKLGATTVPLSSHEFDLLLVMAEHAGELVSRDMLIKRIRGIEYDGFDRSIDISVSRLRRKLNDATQVADRIVTVRGKGYLLTPGDS